MPFALPAAASAASAVDVNLARATPPSRSDTALATSQPRNTARTITMGLSKTNRILILLAIDSAFFLLELVVGM